MRFNKKASLISNLFIALILKTFTVHGQCTDNNGNTINIPNYDFSSTLQATVKYKDAPNYSTGTYYYKRGCGNACIRKPFLFIEGIDFER